MTMALPMCAIDFTNDEMGPEELAIAERISELKEQDKISMRLHASHHSKKHLEEMVKDLKRGLSFEQSHNKAYRKVGK